jgi:hypothetical protein
MSEGDILRLNRMYKCGEEKFSDPSVQMQMNQTLENEKAGEHADEGHNIDEQLVEDELINKELVQDELLGDDELSSSRDNSLSRRNPSHQDKKSPEAVITSLKQVTNDMFEHIKPLCDLKKQLKSLMIAIRDMR